MTPSWRPDPGWTGDWTIPPLLSDPISERARANLVLLSAQGFGPKRLVDSLQHVDRVEEVSAAHPARARAAITALDRVGVRALVPSDDEYPDDLAHIDAAPVLLYVRGEDLRGLRPAVGIVGARACTSGAAKFARRLGEAFAWTGYTVVSGLARGIDAAAHKGALEAGRTIAVLGTGPDICYPPEHRELCERVARAGAVVSEFPLGVGPRAWHFPARNRIIAGLSSAVVVVEAGSGSGALITAGFALDNGRHVLACTTGPENPAGAGVREMLREGATLVVDPEHAVEVVGELLADQGLPFCVPRTPKDRAADLTGDLRTIYDAVLEDVTVEDVARTSETEMARVASLLGELELEGLVVSSDGRWRRVT